MHFEILVEDQSGKKALDILVPKIIHSPHTFMIHPYKGIGRIPKNLGAGGEARQRILLDQLPKLLAGYGKTFAGYPRQYPAALFIVCDLDDRCLKTFRQELFRIVEGCRQKPETRFCVAIEEGEAWFLGDIPAIKTAYPKARNAVLKSYKNDAICGTWECLADAIYDGGVKKLSQKGWRAIGREKSIWAETITPHMDVMNNLSPSFNYFRKKLVELADRPASATFSLPFQDIS